MGIKEGIIFDMLPIPPSENEAYPTDFTTGRRFASNELKDFKSRMQVWSLRRVAEIAKIQEELKWALADHRKCVRVDTWMFFQYESLFTKPASLKDRPRRKKMDPHNKAKPLYDCLAAMLGVDDSRFIAGPIIPVHRTDPRGQYCQVKLTFEMIPTDEELWGDRPFCEKI